MTAFAEKISFRPEIGDHAAWSENSAGPLRVLLVSTSSGSRGGGELYLVGLANQLTSDGHQVQVVLSDHSRMDDLAKMVCPAVRVERIPYHSMYDRRLRTVGSILDRRSVCRLTRSLRQFEPEIIHINKQNVEDGLDLVSASRQTGLPWIATIHITHSMHSLRAFGGRLRDLLARSALSSSASHYLTIANACRNELIEYLRTAKALATVHMVRNGVPPSPNSDRASLRREWNCGAQDIVLGCVARLEQQKNPLFLIELLTRLSERVRLVWVGDGRLRGEFEIAAARAGVADRVRIEGWRTDARARMAGFDIFVLPSYYEGLPLAVLEAMAARLPCVVSDTDGVREAVIDGYQGCLLPPGDTARWVSAIAELIDHEQLRARYGAAAFLRYNECFSVEAMTAATVGVYRKVVEEFRLR